MTHRDGYRTQRLIDICDRHIAADDLASLDRLLDRLYIVGTGVYLGQPLPLETAWKEYVFQAVVVVKLGRADGPLRSATQSAYRSSLRYSLPAIAAVAKQLEASQDIAQAHRGQP